MTKTIEGINDLIEQAESYEEMDRDFPTFGVGNLIEKLNELLKTAEAEK